MSGSHASPLDRIVPSGKTEAIEGRRRSFLLASSLALFLLSLFSKGQAVSLAPTLLLVDHLKGRKIADRRGLLEKAPFFLLALIFGVAAIRAQRSAAAIFDNAARSFFDRILFASYGLAMYLAKLVLPLRLSAVYPYPVRGEGALPVSFYVCPLVVLGLIAAAAWSFRRSRETFFGISFSLVNIALVLQLLPVGNAIMADRYSYVPSLGIFVLAGIAYRRLTVGPAWKLLAAPRRDSGRSVWVRILGCGYILFLTAATVMRCGVWKDSLTLWSDAVAKSPTSEIAWSSLGSVHDAQGKDAQALEDYTRAIQNNPGFAKAYASRARCRTRLADLQGAVMDADKAVQLRPDLAYAQTTRGNVALALNDVERAGECYRRAMEIDPADADAYAGRGAMKRKSGDPRGALADLETAVRLRPDSAENHSNRGILKAESGDRAGARADFDAAIRLNPDQPGPYLNRAIVNLGDADRPAACADLREAQRRGARVPPAIVQQACGS